MNYSGKTDIVLRLRDPGPPSKKLNFKQMRNFIRTNFSKFYWAPIIIENKCINPPPTPPPTITPLPSSAPSAPSAPSKTSDEYMDVNTSTETTKSASSDDSYKKYLVSNVTPVTPPKSDEYLSLGNISLGQSTTPSPFPESSPQSKEYVSINQFNMPYTDYISPNGTKYKLDSIRNIYDPKDDKIIGVLDNDNNIKLFEGDVKVPQIGWN